MNINLTLFAQAVSFTAFIWFTVKFVWPHMLRAIESRQKTIADGLAAAEQGRKSLESSTRQADQDIKRAVARSLETSEVRLHHYVIDRHETGNLTVRPEAVFG